MLTKVTLKHDDVRRWHTQYRYRERKGSGVARCQKVGGGGAHRHVIFVPSVKNQYKRVVFGCMVI